MITIVVIIYIPWRIFSMFFKPFFHLWKILVISLFSLKYYLTQLFLFTLPRTLIWKILESIDLFYTFLYLFLIWHLLISFYSLVDKFCSFALQFKNLLFFFISCTIIFTIHSSNQYSKTALNGYCYASYVIRVYYILMTHIIGVGVPKYLYPDRIKTKGYLQNGD